MACDTRDELGPALATEAATADADNGDEAMVDACLEFREPSACGGPSCEWRQGFQIEFDLGACGCARTDKGLCVAAGSYDTVDGPEAYVFDGSPDTVVVLENALDPVPEGVAACTASSGEYCTCAVEEANYCDF